MRLTVSNYNNCIIMCSAELIFDMNIIVNTHNIFEKMIH